jgi:hypothetical protein
VLISPAIRIKLNWECTTLLYGDQGIVIMQTNLIAAGMTDTPKASDKVYVNSRSFTVQSAAALYAGSSIRAWDFQGR